VHENAPEQSRPIAMTAASSAHNPLINSLLASFARDDSSNLSRHLEWVSMPLGSGLHGPSELIKHAYFPCTAIVSLHYITSLGASAEIAGVGSEGMIGSAIFMGADSTLNSATVHTGGYGYRVERRALQQAFEHSLPLRQVLLRYMQALMTQIVQTAACYRHHSVEQQLGSWLMATYDRMQEPDELVMTQELLASLLGVRRESITQAAGKLQALGLISYRRGHIRVISVSGLRSYACECYSVVRTELQRLASCTKKHGCVSEQATRNKIVQNQDPGRR